MNPIKSESLQKFSDISDKITKDTYWVEKKANNNNTILFSEYISDSLNELINFENELAINYSNLSLRDNQNEENYFFYSFLFNLITSEFDNINLQENNIVLDPFSRTSKKIILLAQNILNLSTSNSINLSIDCKNTKNKINIDFNKHFQELFTNIFTYFDFIKNENNIAFSKFETNNELFEKQKGIIFDFQILTINNLDDLWLNINNLVIENIKESTKYLISDNIVTNMDILGDYMDNQADKDKDPVILEPFSYILLKKLKWFTDYTKKSNENININDFTQWLENFIKNYIDITSDFYDSKISLHEYYLEIHKIDIDFMFNYLYKE